MPVTLKSRPVVKILKLYKPLDDRVRQAILLRRSESDQFIYSAQVRNTLGDKIRKNQRRELKISIQNAKNGEPRDLLRKINCNAFDAIKSELPAKIFNELDKTSDPSLITIFKQALDWTKGNYTGKWWP